MRAIDRKKNLKKVNILAEQRYLESKSGLYETTNEAIGEYRGDIPFIPGKNELLLVKNQVEDLKPNFTINYDALKIMGLNLEITYDLDNKLYKVRNASNGDYYVNNMFNVNCVDCEFRRPEDVIKFIRHKAEGGDVKYMPI